MPAAAKKPPQDDRKKLASSEPSADRGSIARAEPEGATGITGNKWPIVDPRTPRPPVRVALPAMVATGCAGVLAIWQVSDGHVQKREWQGTEKNQSLTAEITAAQTPRGQGPTGRFPGSG